jgi:hypothetical protein
MKLGIPSLSSKQTEPLIRLLSDEIIAGFSDGCCLRQAEPVLLAAPMEL